MQNNQPDPLQQPLFLVPEHMTHPVHAVIFKKLLNSEIFMILSSIL